MALTESEKLELQGLLTAEYGQPYDLSKLNDSEIAELASLISGQPLPTSVMETVRAGVASTIDAATLGNLAEIGAGLSSLTGESFTEQRAKIEDALAQLKQRNPGASMFGTGVGFTANFIPAAAALKGLALTGRAGKAATALDAALTVKPMQGLSTLARLGEIARGTAIGAGQAFVADPGTRTDELGARIENVKDIAPYAALFSTLPTAGKYLGDKMYESAFKNAEKMYQLKGGKGSLTELMKARGYTGSMADMARQLQDEMNSAYAARKAQFDVPLQEAGTAIPVDRVEKQLTKNLSQPGVGVTDELDSIRSFIGKEVGNYQNASFKDKMKQYKDQFYQYLQDLKNFQKAGGTAEGQLPLGTVDPTKTYRPVLSKVELQGQAPKVMTAEPVEPFYNQPELFPMPVLPGDRFNPMRSELDLLPESQKLAMDDLYKRILSNDPTARKNLSSAAVAEIDQNLSDLANDRIDLGQFKANVKSAIYKDTQSGAIQSEILNTGLTPRTYAEAPSMAPSTEKGQIPFALSPQAPVEPTKNYSWNDFNEFLSNIGEKAKKGFTVPKTGQAILPKSKELAKVYGGGKDLREAIVGEQMGQEAQSKYAALNKQMSEVNQVLPYITRGAIDEAADPILDAYQGMFFMNPYTAKGAAVRAGLDFLDPANFLTKTGKALPKAAQSNWTNIPFYLQKDSEKKDGN